MTQKMAASRDLTSNVSEMCHEMMNPDGQSRGASLIRVFGVLPQFAKHLVVSHVQSRGAASSRRAAIFSPDASEAALNL